MRIGRQVATAMIGASVAFGGVATGVATLAPSAAAQEVVAEAIGAGDTATVTANFLNIRQTPSLSGTITQTLPFGAQVSVVTGPVVADGYTWYRVQVNGAFIGWAVTAFLGEVSTGTPGTPTTPGGTFTYGQTVTVNTSQLNVRSLPTTAASVVTVYSLGRTARITSDARTADGITWFAVDNLGWVASQYLSAGGTSTPGTPGTPAPPAGSFPVGSTVRVNAATVNVRTGAGLSFPAAYTASAGDTFTILEGPVAANGYSWYRVSNLVGAWVAGSFLSQTGTAPTTPTTPAPGGAFTYGQTVTVTASALNVRSLPTTSASVLTTYASGRTARITSEARTADGITWYAVDNLGWVSAAYLRA